MNAILRIAAWMIAVMLVTAPVVAVLNGWIGGARWPMRHLAVTGEFRLVSDAQVRDAVLPAVRDGFFAVRLEHVRSAVQKLPWVRRVDVRKRWPDRLEVSVGEYRPLARWGDKQMLSENGELFPAPAKIMTSLPAFNGPLDRRADLITLYNDAKPLFLGSGLRVTQVGLSARGSWNLHLSDGMEIEVGRNDPELRLRRFARLLSRVRSRDPRVLVRADLRYTNGFALSWAEPQKPGLGTRDSGLGKSASVAIGPVRHRIACMEIISSLDILRVPSPESRVPSYLTQAVS